MINFMKKKMYDGTIRIYEVNSEVFNSADTLVLSFVLRGYPTASSLEKIRANMDVGEKRYVTLEYRMYEIETNF